MSLIKTLYGVRGHAKPSLYRIMSRYSSRYGLGSVLLLAVSSLAINAVFDACLEKF